MAKVNEVSVTKIDGHPADRSVHMFDPARPLNQPHTDDESLKRQGNWNSVRQRLRQDNGRVGERHFTLDEVEAIVRSAVAEALRNVGVPSEPEDEAFQVSGK